MPSNEYGGMIPRWPYPFRRSPERTLGYLAHGILKLETGEIIEVTTWAEIYELLFARNLLVFAPNIATLPWLPDAIAAGGKLTYSKRTRLIASLKVRKGRYVRQIVLASTWPINQASDLPRLRELFDLCATGPQATPGGLGQALMRRYYPEGAPKLRRPLWGLWKSIHKQLTGGRSDTILTGTFDRVYEVDQCLSYAAMICAGVPCGAVVPILSEATMVELEAKYAWLEVTFTVPPGLSLGLLPRRKDRGVITYPCEGTYDGAFTLEEVKHAREKGYEIEIRRGWIWLGDVDAFGAWANACDDLRKRAADFGGDKWLKLAVVAAIGSFAQDDSNYELELVTSGKQITKATPVVFAGRDNELVFALRRKYARNRAGHLIHVAAHVWARGRMSLWEQCELYQHLGHTVVATNYDALYVLEKPPDPPAYGLGEWKWKEYTNAKFDRRRWFVSNEKVTTPGAAHT